MLRTRFPLRSTRLRIFDEIYCCCQRRVKENEHAIDTSAPFSTLRITVETKEA